MGDVRDAPGTEWDGHVLLLHRTEGERLAGLIAWVRRGLELGEKIIYTELPLMPEVALVPVLEARGVDVAAAVGEGQLVVLPPEEFYPPEGQRVVVERALAEGFPAVRISAEVRAALSVLSPSGVHGVEQQLDALVGDLPMSAMCQYSEATTTGTWLDDAVATHLSGVHQSSFSTSRDLDGLALHGEVDATNTDVFTAVLSAASRHRSQVLWVDLGEVTYVDAGSCWRLDDATRYYRSSGGHVVLVALQPPVELAMRMLEVDELPGMHLVGGER
ncbi:MEDS domain-containing protein [Geodermatophilus ruber]|uniref:Anti-anti-sigma regulatory factor (Antagonist of anti-sigma factor) n=1 Tax=Geodermatophilus ruber TaxID=504800 RepID=A0A1I3YZS8_9ACTN|nr:MEDS domain-containing protein [Geodermatophilus ruber]SFK37367.1 Anti-anti-sigma regulatory factor (antagonist of anti-sigma factor) [Geodermatophilus ruber]